MNLTFAGTQLQLKGMTRWQSMTMKKMKWLKKSQWNNHIWMNQKSTNISIQEDRQVHLSGMELMSMLILHFIAMINQRIQKVSWKANCLRNGEAVDSEYQSLMENETWELTIHNTTPWTKPVGCRRPNMEAMEQLNSEHYKVRLVAKEYAQKHGEEYSEMYSHLW